MVPTPKLEGTRRRSDEFLISKLVIFVISLKQTPKPEPLRPLAGFLIPAPILTPVTSVLLERCFQNRGGPVGSLIYAMVTSGNLGFRAEIQI